MFFLDNDESNFNNILKICLVQLPFQNRVLLSRLLKLWKKLCSNEKSNQNLKTYDVGGIFAATILRQDPTVPVEESAKKGDMEISAKMLASFITDSKLPPLLVCFFELCKFT
jgi:hypothetical protein